MDFYLATTYPGPKKKPDDFSSGFFVLYIRLLIFNYMKTKPIGKV